MPLPFSIVSKIELQGELLDVLSPKGIAQKIFSGIEQEKYQNCSILDDKIEFSHKNSLFSLSYTFQIKVLQIENEKFIIGKIELDNLLKLSTVAAFLPAFFTFLDFSRFLFYSPIFFLAFYFVNLFFVKQNFNKLLKKVLGNNHFSFNKPEEFSAEQEKWQDDPNKCSACGSEIIEIDLTCPDCGINLKRNKFSIPLNVSKYQSKNIRYSYKKK